MFYLTHPEKKASAISPLSHSFYGHRRAQLEDALEELTDRFSRAAYYPQGDRLRDIFEDCAAVAEFSRLSQGPTSFLAFIHRVALAVEDRFQPMGFDSLSATMLLNHVFDALYIHSPEHEMELQAFYRGKLYEGRALSGLFHDLESTPLGSLSRLKFRSVFSRGDPAEGSLVYEMKLLRRARGIGGLFPLSSKISIGREVELKDKELREILSAIHELSKLRIKNHRSRSNSSTVQLSMPISELRFERFQSRLKNLGLPVELSALDPLLIELPLGEFSTLDLSLLSVETKLHCCGGCGAIKGASLMPSGMEPSKLIEFKLMLASLSTACEHGEEQWSFEGANRRATLLRGFEPLEA